MSDNSGTESSEETPETEDATRDEESTARAVDLVDALADPAVVDDGPVEVGNVAPADELLRRVEAATPEATARALATLGRTATRLDGEAAEQRERAEDLADSLRRKQAEFKNYKKRQQKRMEEERERATEDLVSRLVEVRDNLQRALDTDEGVDIRDGVESTLAQFDRELDRENVEVLEPDPGEAVDPERHEVLATVSAEQPEDAIAGLHRPGYEMAGKVLRPAQVTVSKGGDGGTDKRSTDDRAADDAAGETGDGTTGEGGDDTAERVTGGDS